VLHFHGPLALLLTSPAPTPSPPAYMTLLQYGSSPPVHSADVCIYCGRMFIFSSFRSFSSGSPSEYVRESPLAQCRSPFGLASVTLS